MTFFVAAIGAGAGVLAAPVGSALLYGAVGAGIGGTIGSSMSASKAAKSASQMQANAAQSAQDQQRAMFDIQNEQQAPYREAGYSALNKIQDMLPYFTKQPTAEDLLAMPGMQFGLTQGLGATREALNVGGGGSNVTRGAIKFANDYGANVALPAYNKQRTDIYNTLSNLAGLGQKAQESTGTLAQNVTSNIGQLGVGAASALGAGQIGSANAYSGGMQNIGNAAMMYSLLNKTPIPPVA
jgi:hypothetical protein